MKIITRLTAIAIAGVVICYFGLSGYVWYHDNQRSKQADVQASTLEENNKVLGFYAKKDAIIVTRLQLNYLSILLFLSLSS